MDPQKEDAIHQEEKFASSVSAPGLLGYVLPISFRDHSKNFRWLQVAGLA